jgi:hypothetical protein
VVLVSDLRFDFDFLARETLALTEQLRNKSLKSMENEDFEFKSLSNENLNDLEQIELNFFDDAFDFSAPDKPIVEGHSCEEERSLSGPGVVYKLEKGISTFCLRGMATSDMEWEADAIERKDPQILKKLRIDPSDTNEAIGFFPTYDLAFAETVVDQLINRRFPKQEAIVCNLSDPGFSWWLSCDDSSIEVYFQSHGIERDENLIQLGPLGDPFIAYQFFKKSFSFFKSQFSIHEFSATEKGLRISCGMNSIDTFQKLVKLFIEGIYPWEESFFQGHNNPDKSLLLYFYELSVLRSFWIDVQRGTV